MLQPVQSAGVCCVGGSAKLCVYAESAVYRLAMEQITFTEPTSTRHYTKMSLTEQEEIACTLSL